MSDFSYKMRIRGVEGLQICTPSPIDVEEKYKISAENNADMMFPYWTRLWPSSIAMSRYIRLHSEEFSGKSILELGAGLGLPSFIASPIADKVLVTDYVPEAIVWLEENIKRLGLNNVDAEILDWTKPVTVKADIVLMSDLCYDPESFDPLIRVINHYLDQNTRVIIALPERVISGQFYHLVSKDIVDSSTYAIEDKRVVVVSLMR